MQSDGRIPDEKTSATPSITAAPPPTPDGHLGQIGMTMHHRIAIASSMEARRASMDVSRRISIDARQGRQSSMLPAYSGILEEVATASEIYTHSQVQSSSRPSTPLLQSGPERSSNSLPDMQRSGELQRPRSDGLASKGSPFAHPSQQQCSKTQQKASGVVKAAGLLAVLLVCCLGVWSVNQTAGSFMPLVRRQLNANKRAARGEALAGIVTQCPPNTYAGPSGCKACGIGLVTTGPGATSQDACVAPAGSYMFNKNRGKLCPKGTYTSDFNKAKSCTPCGDGLTTAKRGSTSIAACITKTTAPAPAGSVPDPNTSGQSSDLDASNSPAPGGASPDPTSTPQPSPSLGDAGLEPQIEDPPLPVASPIVRPNLPGVDATAIEPGSSPSASPAASDSGAAPSPSPKVIDLDKIQVIAQPIGLDDPMGAPPGRRLLRHRV